MKRPAAFSVWPGLPWRAFQHLGDDFGSGKVLIRHKVTQGDLAAMAGVARESVNRIVGVRRRQNIAYQSAHLGYLVHKATLEQEAALEDDII